MFTIRNLTDLAAHFAQKAKEMNDIAQQRTGLSKHNYAGQAHAYNDAAIIIRNCRIQKKGKQANEEV